MQIKITRIIAKSLVLIFVTLFLSACASSVVVKGDIPSPLVNKLPLTGSLVYTDEFRNYTYVESQKRRKGVVASFDFKEAQVSMFDRIFGALLNLVDNDAPAKDLTIEPEILDFQYSTPAETSTTQYEVWLKYRLKILDGDNQNVGDWVVKGYGKTPTAMLQSTGSAFNAAANVALRDVGAQLAIRFPSQSSVQELVNAKADAQGASFIAQTDAEELESAVSAAAETVESSSEEIEEKFNEAEASVEAAAENPAEIPATADQQANPSEDDQ